MNDVQNTLKYSLVFGLTGAVFIPLFYEVYANISKTAGLVLIAVWAAAAGIKLSAERLKHGILGATACLAYTGVLGIVCYTVIHPAAVSFLNAHAKYIQLSLEEQAWFLLYAALIGFSMYLICAARRGMMKAASLIKGNGDKAAAYIPDAFDDYNGEHDK